MKLHKARDVAAEFFQISFGALSTRSRVPSSPTTLERRPSTTNISKTLQLTPKLSQLIHSTTMEEYVFLILISVLLMTYRIQFSAQAPNSRGNLNFVLQSTGNTNWINQCPKYSSQNEIRDLVYSHWSDQQERLVQGVQEVLVGPGLPDENSNKVIPSF